MGGDDVQITLDGKLVQRMRQVLPTGTMSISKRAGKIITQWLDDQEAIKAADAAERRSKGKPNVSATDLYRECGL